MYLEMIIKITAMLQVTMASIILAEHLQQKWKLSFDEDDELYQWHLFHEPVKAMTHVELTVLLRKHFYYVDITPGIYTSIIGGSLLKWLSI